MPVNHENIVKILGKKDAKYLLDFDTPKIAREDLLTPGFRHLEHTFAHSNRNKKTTYGSCFFVE